MVEMIDDRCSIEETDQKFSLVIEGKLEKVHETMLFAWILLWISLGVYAMYELANGGVNADGEAYTREIFLAIKIYLVFWAYFLFKIGRAFLWSRAGKEYILLKDNVLLIKKAIYSYGRTREYQIENISDIRIPEKKEQSFQEIMESSFWVLGGERVRFEHFGRQHGFGRKLNDDTANKLLQRFKKRLTQIKKKPSSEEE